MFVKWLVVISAFGLVLLGQDASLLRNAAAEDATILSQPWAKWDETAKPVRGGTFRLAAPLFIGRMNPNHWPVNDWVTMSRFMERLYLNDGNYEPTNPCLVESLTYESPTVVIMKLRKGVTFHDGSPFNASSVKYQFEWIIDPKNGAWTAGSVAPIDFIDIVDEHTLRWTLKHPWAGFEGMLATAPGYALSEAALRGDQSLLDSEPVGTGAYMFADASPDNYIKLKRNPNWWFAAASGNSDMPYFDEIVVSVIPDPQVRLANLRAGKLDALLLDKSQYALAMRDPKLQVFKWPRNALTALRFNSVKGVFTDIRLRKAVSHAIDREALIFGTQFGLGRLASAMYPNDHWAHNPNLEPVPHDPELAKQLLAEAGYGDGLTITGFVYNTTGSQTVAEAIKAMLLEVGIDWQVESVPPPVAAAKIQQLNFDLAGSGWSWIFDPDRLATGLYHPEGGFNFGRDNKPEIVALVEAGRKETERAARQKIYWDLEEAVYNDYQDVFLWWEENAFAIRDKVKGWDNEAFLAHKDAYFWSHHLWFEDGTEQ